MLFKIISYKILESSFAVVEILFIFQLQEYKSKMQETQMDLQRQLQAAKKVSRY